MADRITNSPLSPVFVDVDDNDDLCAVCLQTKIHPTATPCGHIFCFLCVKGLIRTSKACAMCRAPLPSNAAHDPDILLGAIEAEEVGFDDGQDWYYEARGGAGWWQYDPRTSEAIEAAFQQGAPTCEVSISGIIYVIDFTTMEQRQKRRRTKTRRIKRDSVSISKRGIAGIRWATQATSDDGLDTGPSLVN